MHFMKRAENDNAEKKKEEIKHVLQTNENILDGKKGIQGKVIR